MRRALAAAVLAASVIAPASAAAATDGRYTAEIRRTAGGMPHIKARDYGSLGFGTGYAYASDQICRFADIMATVNAQRSRYFGPDASYGDLGGQTNNLESDFFFARINASGVVERLARRRYPAGPGADVRANVRGFVAGYNAYLRRTGRARLPDPRCRGKAWVRPITVRQLYRRFYQLGQRASGQALLGGLVAAAPPGTSAAAAGSRLDAGALRATLDRAGGMGSNGYAIGADGARGGDALLLSNTHFPSGTDVRWYELHLTIPGRYDAIGAALQGLPVINVGFNRHVAWTHTVSTARRFAAYELEARPRPADVVSRRRQGRADAPAHRARPGPWRSDALAHVLRDALGTGGRPPGRDVQLDGRHRLRAGRRQRRPVPADQPVGAVEPRDLRARLAPQGRRDPGQSVGQLDRRRRSRQRLLRRRRRRAAPRPGLPRPLRRAQEPAAARRGRDRGDRRNARRLPAAERRGRARPAASSRTARCRRRRGATTR